MGLGLDAVMWLALSLFVAVILQLSALSKQSFGVVVVR